MNNKKLLVTGSAGYIGGTFVYEALKKGFSIIGIDNFSNSNISTTNFFKKKYPKQFKFFEIDIRDRAKLNTVFKENKNTHSIMHFAALKSVSDSEEKFDLYWENNVFGTKNVLEVMKENEIKNIIFSSSAAIYGEQNEQPIPEDSKPNPKSKYALTKLESEKLISRFADKGILKAISLRYFNPVGSHKDSFIFEDFNYSSNLMSEILKVASMKKQALDIYGTDYPTNDGTAERDFIHIEDLIDGHFAALEKITHIKNYEVINLGTGLGVSVLEMVNTFKEINKLNFEVNFIERRKGDICVSFACVERAKEILDWESSYNLKKMCKDAWKVIQNEAK
tara:strand:- start:202 stop:1209 length:1008 start_codon:yes stop_codon:yes gene_type:complete